MRNTNSISDGLLSPAFFSGWGVRTIVTGERRYNPMSYHNGSVWPHDNALIALGALRRTDKELALRITSGLFDLASEVMFRRLPELICGFGRRPGKGPTLYPVACSPQAWAAGSVFMVLQACLGLEIRAGESGFICITPHCLRNCNIFAFATSRSETAVSISRANVMQTR